jgi:hypothetical protein
MSAESRLLDYQTSQSVQSKSEHRVKELADKAGITETKNRGGQSDVPPDPIVGLSNPGGAVSVGRGDSTATFLNPDGNGNAPLSDSPYAPRGSPPSQAQPQGINTVARNALISTTGREFGPDIALKVGPNIVGKEAAGEKMVGDESKDIINSKSSITEVLNILAFLLNEKTQRNDSVIKDFSYDHDGIFEKLYASFKDSAPPLFDIKKLTLTSSAVGVEGTSNLPPVSITIPNTILKRDESYALKKEPITIESKDIQPLISACILQMVNILENTRQVFGGWAKLFKGMQGGSNSKSKTKTRRNNRRRH